MEQQINQEEQLDIVWLFKYIYTKLKFICTCVGVMLLLCIIIWAVKPKKYIATASILPISEDQGMLSSLSGNMGALASLAGVNLSGSSKSSTIITADLYPKVVESVPFLSYMIDVPLPWTEPTDTVMTFWEHAYADTIPTLGQTIFNYTLGLPRTIAKALSPQNPAQH